MELHRSSELTKQGRISTYSHISSNQNHYYYHYYHWDEREGLSDLLQTLCDGVCLVDLVYTLGLELPKPPLAE